MIRVVTTSSLLEDLARRGSKKLDVFANSKTALTELADELWGHERYRAQFTSRSNFDYWLLSVIEQSVTIAKRA